jgi:hypothetical protein
LIIDLNNYGDLSYDKIKIINETAKHLGENKKYLDEYIEKIHWTYLSIKGYSKFFCYLYDIEYPSNNISSLLNEIRELEINDKDLSNGAEEIVKTATLEFVKYSYTEGDEFKTYLSSLDIEYLENEVYGNFDNEFQNFKFFSNQQVPLDKKTILEKELIPPLNGYDIKYLSNEVIEEKKDDICDLLFYLSKVYPDGFLDKYINGIYLVHELKAYDGKIPGGLAQEYSIYLVYTDMNEVSLIHNFMHEFGHIIFSTHKDLFNEEEWKNCNPDDFEYICGDYGEVTKEVMENINFKDEQDIMDTLNSGFLSKYAQSNIKEDFAETNRLLFEYHRINALSEELEKWDLENFKNLEKKVKILRDFYYQIDNRFNEEYFNNISPIIFDDSGNILYQNMISLNYLKQKNN